MQLNEEHKKIYFKYTHTSIFAHIFSDLCGALPCPYFCHLKGPFGVRRLDVAICISSPSSSLLGAELWESHFGGDSWSSSVFGSKRQFILQVLFCGCSWDPALPFHGRRSVWICAVRADRACQKSGLLGSAANQVFSLFLLSVHSSWAAEGLGSYPVLSELN